MRITPGRVPPLGCHYEVAPGVTLRAPTFDALYALITEYRARHALPPGDPRKDVDDYVCGRWPHFCQPERREQAPAAAPKLSVRVAEWAATLIRGMPAGGYELVDTREAARRAEICRTCPFQENWRARCTPCNASTESLLATVRRMKQLGINRELLGCKLCGRDNPTACFLPDSALKPTDEIKSTLPAHCWLTSLT